MDSQSRGHSLRIALMYKLDKLKTSPAASMHASVGEDSKDGRASQSDAGTSTVAKAGQTSSADTTSESDKTGDTESERVTDHFEHPSSEGFALNYIEREGDALRKKLLHSLAMKKIWVPPYMKPKTHQTGIDVAEG